VTLDIGGAQGVAAITKQSAERSGLAAGKPATAIIKAPPT
jgi:molybdopterin-binding protein